jgi:hypothetical protein
MNNTSKEPTPYSPGGGVYDEVDQEENEGEEKNKNRAK